MEASGDLNSLLVEDIQGNRLIHSFNLEKREQERFLKCSQELQKRSLKAMFRWSILFQVPALHHRLELSQ